MREIAMGLPMFFQRVLSLYKRRRAATKLGIQFGRCASFRLPSEVLINGCRQRLFLPDENGVKVAFIELLLDDCYRCKKVLKPINTVIDIGGNVGLFGITARLAFPNAKIHAYEPNPNLEKYLKVQSEAGKFEYFMNAVGVHNGKVSLTFHEDSVQTRSEPSVDGCIDQVAFGLAIDKIGGQVDFVKMDCEGAEWELFDDLKSWRKVNHLSMEYHLLEQHTVSEVLRRVRGLGFYIIHHLPQDGFGLIIASR